MSDAASPQEWAQRFDQQGVACAELGSELYARLLAIIARDIAASGPTWQLIATDSELRFGQAVPLRVLGAAHRLALAGGAPDWAAILPSCGGTVPRSDDDLALRWEALLGSHQLELVTGIGREVQTNEVARAAGLGLALAEADLVQARLVEIGCSAGLNLQLDRFEIDLGGVVLGDAGSAVHLHPELRSDLDRLRHRGASLPTVTARVGIDLHPLDPDDDQDCLTLLSFVWPDQLERLDRVRCAIDLAREHPAELIATGGPHRTAATLAPVLERGGPTVVMHSIMWQYVPPAHRWEITECIETAGRAADSDSPLVWIRYEPDPWDRRRAAVWMRTWPDGADRAVAHVDFHGRWIEPL